MKEEDDYDLGLLKPSFSHPMIKNLKTKDKETSLHSQTSKWHLTCHVSRLATLLNVKD